MLTPAIQGILRLLHTDDDSHEDSSFEVIVQSCLEHFVNERVVLYLITLSGTVVFKKNISAQKDIQQTRLPKLSVTLSVTLHNQGYLRIPAPHSPSHRIITQAAPRTRSPLRIPADSVSTPTTTPSTVPSPLITTEPELPGAANELT